MPKRLHTILALSLVLPCLTACHGPGGGLFPYTGASQTLNSTELSPKTMQLVDLRTNEVLFESVIPPGKQLTYDFVKDSGDDPVLTPDLMRWDIFPLGTRTGRLRNTVSVPNAASRKVRWTIRDGVEYQEDPPAYRMRVDRAEGGQQSWWSDNETRSDAPANVTTLYDN
ncbi:MAG: hypothetical protein ACR2GY_05275 [Phycisphaerales bacterium]